MAVSSQPSIRRIGASVNLVKLEDLAGEFGCSVLSLRKALEILRIPIVTIGDTSAINLFSLEQTFFAACRPGRPNWEFGNTRLELEEMFTPEVAQEMECAAVTYTVASREALRERIRRAAIAMKGEARRKQNDRLR